MRANCKRSPAGAGSCLLMSSRPTPKNLYANKHQLFVISH